VSAISILIILFFLIAHISTPLSHSLYHLAVETCLSAKRLLSNVCRIFAYTEYLPSNGYISWGFYPSFGVHIFVYAACLTRIYKLNLGCLQPVACVRSDDLLNIKPTGEHPKNERQTKVGRFITKRYLLNILRTRKEGAVINSLPILRTPPLNNSTTYNICSLKYVCVGTNATYIEVTQPFLSLNE
jgi:hypothetical protein